MRTERMDIRVYRNADYCEDWQLNDNDGAPIDLTGDTLELRIRANAGQGSVIAAATIDLHDPENGIVTVTIEGAPLSSVAGAGQIVRLAYDLRITYPDGIQAIPAAGHIILTPGATY